MKIVVLDGYCLNPGDLSWDALRVLAEVVVHDRTAADQILERSDGADALLTNKTPLTGETLGQLPGLRYIGVLATGYNIVDVQAARKRGVVVSNIPTYGTASVAQFAIALLLELCHHVGVHMPRGEWSQSPAAGKSGWSSGKRWHCAGRWAQTAAVRRWGEDPR
ncbi:MAG: hypothetical protein WKF37_20470 [Bryobacteraceae bacterium]